MLLSVIQWSIFLVLVPGYFEAAVDKDEDTVIATLGPNVKTSQYKSSSNEQPIHSGEELTCDFETECCWSNAKPPRDQLEWVQAQGLPDPNKFFKTFGTSLAPTEKYLIVATSNRPTNSSAILYSCELPCTNQPIKVTVKYWKTKKVKLQICLQEVSAKQSGDGSLLNCQSLSYNGEPGPGFVSLPPVDHSNVVIIARDMSASSIAVIDEIEVKFIPCANDTSSTIMVSTEMVATPVTTPLIIANDPPSKSAASTDLCKSVVCNFEQDTPCAYQNSADEKNIKFKSWQVVHDKFNNFATGVRKPGEGKVFAASYLKPLEKARFETNSNFNEDFIIKFLVYKVADKIELKGCCDDMTKCPYSSDVKAKISDYSKWHEAAFRCPKDTKKLLFQASNDGDNEGAVGVDDIRLMVPSSDQTVNSTENAC